MTSTRHSFPLGKSGHQGVSTPGMPPSAGSSTPGSVGLSGPGAKAAGNRATCSYIQPSQNFLVSAPAAAFTRRRQTVSTPTLSATKTVSAYNWQHGPATDAISQSIQFGSHTIATVRPVDAKYNQLNLPSFTQIVDALKVIPQKQLTHTTSIVVMPIPHPGSRPGRETIAEGGASDITIYPASSARTANFYDNLILHESGHNYQSSIWQSRGDVAKWGAAIRSDGNHPSQYSSTNFGEDFCEFYVLYVTSLGSNCGLQLSTVYPARCKLMDSYFAR